MDPKRLRSHYGLAFSQACCWLHMGFSALGVAHTYPSCWVQPRRRDQKPGHFTSLLPILLAQLSQRWIFQLHPIHVPVLFLFGICLPSQSLSFLQLWEPVSSFPGLEDDPSFTPSHSRLKSGSVILRQALDMGNQENQRRFWLANMRGGRVISAPPVWNQHIG